MQVEVQETSGLVQVGEQGDRRGQAADQRGQQGAPGDAAPVGVAPQQTGQGKEEGGDGQADQEKVLNGPRQPAGFPGKTEDFNAGVHDHPP